MSILRDTSGAEGWGADLSPGSAGGDGVAPVEMRLIKRSLTYKHFHPVFQQEFVREVSNFTVFFSRRFL